MAYVEPNVAVFLPFHMPVHSEGGERHKYAVHTFSDMRSHTHTKANGSH